MADFRTLRSRYHVVLKAALVIQAESEMLDVLTGLAELYIEHDKKGEAAGLLAFVLAHPATHMDTYNEAENLWLELETTLCPRVIWDAQVRAQDAQLDEIVGEVLTEND